MPNAQCPMPNAQCPMPNAQCSNPIPTPDVEPNQARTYSAASTTASVAMATATRSMRTGSTAAWTVRSPAAATACASARATGSGARSSAASTTTTPPPRTRCACTRATGWTTSRPITSLAARPAPATRRVPRRKRAAPSTVACPARPSATVACVRTRHGSTLGPRARWRWRTGWPGRQSGSPPPWRARCSATSCGSYSRSRSTRCARARATPAAGVTGPRRSRWRPTVPSRRGNASRTTPRATTVTGRCSKSTISTVVRAAPFRPRWSSWAAIASQTTRASTAPVCSRAPH